MNHYFELRSTLGRRAELLAERVRRTIDEMLR